MTVIRRILRDQDQLTYSGIAQLAGFLHDHGNGSRDSGPFDQRNSAERARTAAPVSDLEIRAGTGNRDTQCLVLILTNGFGFIRQMIQRLRMRTLTQLAHDLHNIHPAPCSQNAINARDFHGNLRAITLGKAPRRNQDLALSFAFGQLAQDIDRFLFGRTNKATGIHNQHIRS